MGEVKYPDNFENWPAMWKSTFEDGVKAEQERQSKLKPLTVERLQQIIIDHYGHEPGNWVDEKGFEDCSWKTAEAIHAALPPDQSDRIAELEQQRDELLKLLENCQEQMIEYANLLEQQGWTRHQAAEIAGAKATLNNLSDAIFKIKGGS